MKTIFLNVTNSEKWSKKNEFKEEKGGFVGVLNFFV